MTNPAMALLLAIMCGTFGELDTAARRVAAVPLKFLWSNFEKGGLPNRGIAT